MDFAEYKDVLVVLELDEGKPVNVSLENIAAAKSVANGGKVIAVTVCENAAKTAKKAFRENMSLKQACVELGFLTSEKFDEVFHPEEMI